MPTSIYVASTEARSGKALATLGLMELASRRVGRLGFFRPVVREAASGDIELMRRRYGAADDRGSDFDFACLYDEAQKLAASAR